jgi:hypothetical protein
MHLYKLHSNYKELKGDLSPILKLYTLLKREGIRPKDLEWFVLTVNTGMYKIRDSKAVCQNAGRARSY